MTSLQDFKQNILGPLLRGEQPTADSTVSLFAAALDRPLDYIFESDRWDEISGASRRVARAGENLRSILASDGYAAGDLLHNTPNSILALCHDEAVAKRWAEAIERAVAQETDIVTVSTVVHSLPVPQLTQGLYRSPRSVIGVPGVNDYQERINRYYGLTSPSTVPGADGVAQRRHFGEVVALLHGLLNRAEESRQILPFYEALPFAERCTSCRTRPAEQLDRDGMPVCGVCLHKRSEARSSRLDRAGIVWIEAMGLDQLLEQQRSPSSYQRLCSELNETLQKAAPSNTQVLTVSNGSIAWIASAATALESATSALESITLHYGLRTPIAIAASVAFGPSSGAYRSLYKLAYETTSYIRRTAEGNTTMLDVRVAGQPFDRLRKPFSLDEARQLAAGIALLRDANLPSDLFPDLATQLARGTASLYYTFERSKLPQATQQTLQRLERIWEIGSVPGSRFFAMLSTMLALIWIKS